MFRSIFAYNTSLRRVPVSWYYHCFLSPSSACHTNLSSWLSWFCTILLKMLGGCGCKTLVSDTVKLCFILKLNWITETSHVKFHYAGYKKSPAVARFLCSPSGVTSAVDFRHCGTARHHQHRRVLVVEWNETDTVVLRFPEAQDYEKGRITRETCCRRGEKRLPRRRMRWKVFLPVTVV